MNDKCLKINKRKKVGRPTQAEQQELEGLMVLDGIHLYNLYAARDQHIRWSRKWREYNRDINATPVWARHECMRAYADAQARGHRRDVERR
jgi:hypothetical protein